MRIALLGLALHAIALAAAGPGGPTSARAAALIAGGFLASLVWTLRKPLADGAGSGWRRTVTETAVIGLCAGMFALGLGWAALHGPSALRPRTVAAPVEP